MPFDNAKLLEVSHTQVSFVSNAYFNRPLALQLLLADSCPTPAYFNMLLMRAATSCSPAPASACAASASHWRHSAALASSAGAFPAVASRV